MTPPVVSLSLSLSRSSITPDSGLYSINLAIFLPTQCFRHRIVQSAYLTQYIHTHTLMHMYASNTFHVFGVPMCVCVCVNACGCFEDKSVHTENQNEAALKANRKTQPYEEESVER